jgi:HD superfamily phosphohydrolase
MLKDSESHGPKPRRFRDPIYDLYTFCEKTVEGITVTPDAAMRKRIDQTALDLIDTPAFQRLRRIRQLGFAEHVYPGASHTRFAHSLGVYAGAQMILQRLKGKGVPPPVTNDFFIEENQEDAVLAALLHDVGHGPFSHAFEKVHEAIGLKKSHESWTRDIILHKGTGSGEPNIVSILGEHRAKRIADLLDGESRSSCWSAIVSSAFDADRLDYVRRDRVMAGTGTGAIDFTWLLEHVALAPLNTFDPPILTFAIDSRALQQAETFLLARYQLYDQVYFHKICRGLEKLLTACIVALAQLVKRGETEAVGLPANNLLVQHLDATSGLTVESYLRIDDTVVIAALQQVAASPGSKVAGTETIRDLASRLVNRKHLECLDLEQWAKANFKRYAPVVKAARTFAKRDLGLAEGVSCFFDEPTLSIYGKTRPDVHKKLWVYAKGRKEPVEISEVSAVIRGQSKVRQLGRLFFFDPSHREDTETFLRSKLGELPDARMLV